MKWWGYAALRRVWASTGRSSASSGELSAIFHDNSKSCMRGSVYFLDDIRGSFDNSEKRLDKNGVPFSPESNCYRD